MRLTRGGNPYPTGEQRDRNRIMYRKRLNGATLRELADEYGIGPQRVKAICDREEFRESHKGAAYWRGFTWKEAER